MLHRFLHGSLQVPGHHSLQSCVQLVLLLVPGQDGQVLQLLLDGVLVRAVLLAKQLELSNGWKSSDNRRPSNLRDKYQINLQFTNSHLISDELLIYSKFLNVSLKQCKLGQTGPRVCQRFFWTKATLTDSFDKDIPEEWTPCWQNHYMSSNLFFMTGKSNIHIVTHPRVNSQAFSKYFRFWNSIFSWKVFLTNHVLLHIKLTIRTSWIKIWWCFKNISRVEGSSANINFWGKLYYMLPFSYFSAWET